MDVRLPRYAPVILLVASVAACSGNPSTPTAPAALVAQSAITAEPLTVQPEFLHGSQCPVRPPFGLRLSIVVNGGDVILRGMQFRLIDLSGGSVFPDVIPMPSISASPSIPTSAPIPLPEASPIPIPGSSPTSGVFVSVGTSRRLPFFLRFGCGVVPGGTLFITVDATDGAGRSQPSQLRLRVATEP